jgi:hypothetical protein
MRDDIAMRLVVSQAESTGINRVFFRLAVLIVVAWLAMRPPHALPDEKIHQFLRRQFNLTDY